MSRRHFLRGATLGGLALALGCGTDDAEVFSQATTTMSAESATTAPTTSSGTPTEAVATTTPETTTESAVSDPTTTTESAVSDPTTTTGAAVPAATEMLVSFSYTPDGTGKRENPYVAVWVETPDGELVDTVALWFQQGKKGDKWLDDLRRWYRASDNGTDTTMSGATRVAGDYTVAWDFTDLAGTAVGAGSYVLFVESARENGPHHVTSTAFTLGDPTALALADDGELHGVAVDWV